MEKIKRLLFLVPLLVPVTCFGWGSNSPEKMGVVETSSSPAIDDDFSSDSSDDYTAIFNSFTISSGAAHGVAWKGTAVYHETSTGSDDHYVEADVQKGSNGNEYSAVLAKSNGTSYIYTRFNGSEIELRDSGGNFSAQSYDGSYSAGTYTVRIEVDGNDTTVYVDGTARIEYTSSYIGGLTGQYVGIGWQREYTNADLTVDNLKGGEL